MLRKSLNDEQTPILLYLKTRRSVHLNPIHTSPDEYDSHVCLQRMHFKVRIRKENEYTTFTGTISMLDRNVDREIMNCAKKDAFVEFL